MLGQRIGELRAAFGWSQVELAKRLSVAKQTVSNWENGNIQPSIDMLVRLSQIFHVTTDYLLGLNQNASLDISGLDTEQVRILNDLVQHFRNERKETD